MIVFKTLLRTAKHKKNTLILPFIIFIGFIFLSQLNAIKAHEAFEMKTPNIAIHNLDEGGLYAESLVDYLSERTNIITISQEEVADALYYQRISYSLTIPKGFTASLDTATPLKLESQNQFESADGYMVDSQVNEFLSNFQVLKDSGFSDQETLKILNSTETSDGFIELLDGKTDSRVVMSSFSSMELYPMMLTICTIITTLLVTFSVQKIRTRSMLSSTSSRNQNVQLLLGVLFIGHILWFVLKLISIFFLRKYIEIETFGLRLFNSYLFFLFTLSFSFFVSKIVRSKTSQIAILNASTLGLSFLSGVFVPQEFLSGSIVFLSKFSPLYWNVLVTNHITDGLIHFQDLWLPMTIQIGFTLMFTVIGMMISKEKDFASLSQTINTH